MARDTPQQRKSSAEADIRYLSSEIDYLDRKASELRKIREKHKAKLARAEAALERESAATDYAASGN